MTTELPADLPHLRTPVEEARAKIVAALTPLSIEQVALRDLAGRVVGAPVIAPHDLPRHANSAMDGFAIDTATPSPWPLSAHILAGDDPAPLAPGTAAAIATGGVVPDGANAVIPLERVVEERDVITAMAPVEPGAHIRPAGADARAGDQTDRPTNQRAAQSAQNAINRAINHIVVGRAGRDDSHEQRKRGEGEAFFHSLFSGLAVEANH